MVSVECGNKVAWRTFPHDEFEDIVQDALDNGFVGKNATATITDRIRTIRTGRWMEKILVMTDNFTSIWNDCQCSYGEGE